MLKKLGVFKDFSDGSIKNVFENENKGIIEMTLLFNKENVDVVCVPTHHFCNLGCKMCHLTNKRINKAMVPIKIENFYEALISTILDKNEKRRTSKQFLKISFMGVGEPTLNIDLIKSVYMMEDKIKEYGYQTIGYAVSTMMPNTNILKLMDLATQEDIPLKIHFSLHTPIDEDRFELIPSTKVFVKDALNYLKDYRDKFQKKENLLFQYTKIRSSNDPTEIHYTLIKGVNDGDKELNLLCELLKEYRIPIKFIRFNPINNLIVSNNEQKWVKTIHKRIPNLRVKTYSPPGREIGSSCGEFTKHYYHQEIETEEELIEFNNWEKKHKIEI